MSAVMIGTAFAVANDTGLVAGLDPAGAVQLLYLVSGQLWTIGAVFFGLWLVPMGMLVLRSGWMPGLLGWTLVVGGVGYVVSAFAGLVPGLSTVSMVATRSEEHTSELQSLMRISYAVFCLKKKKQN